MKKICESMLLFVFCLINIHAQDIQVNDIGKICLQIRIPDNNSYGFIDKALLKDNLVSIITQNGLVAETNSNFYISPSIEIERIEVAEGGMKNIYVVDAYMLLKVSDNNITYSSITVPLRGSGTTKSLALANAISNISKTSYDDFFHETKQKIFQYFESNKDAIFAKANMYVANEEFDKAITCLMMIPEEYTELYNMATTSACEIYSIKIKAEKEWQKEELFTSNEIILKEAAALLAEHRPYDAIQSLMNYQDSESQQNAVYQSLIKKAESQVNEIERNRERSEQLERQDRLQNERRNYNLLLKEADLNRRRIDAVKTIACEYIRNNPSFRYYIYY